MSFDSKREISVQTDTVDIGNDERNEIAKQKRSLREPQRCLYHLYFRYAMWVIRWECVFGWKLQNYCNRVRFARRSTPNLPLYLMHKLFIYLSCNFQTYWATHCCTVGIINQRHNASYERTNPICSNGIVTLLCLNNCTSFKMQISRIRRLMSYRMCLLTIEALFVPAQPFHWPTIHIVRGSAIYIPTNTDAQTHNHLNIATAHCWWAISRLFIRNISIKFTFHIKSFHSFLFGQRRIRNVWILICRHLQTNDDHSDENIYCLGYHHHRVYFLKFIDRLFFPG